MFQKQSAGKAPAHIRQRIIAIVLMTILVLAFVSSIGTAKAVYIINDGTTSTTVESATYAPSDIVNKAGIQVAASDQITAEKTGSGTVTINITRSQNVTVNYQGASLHIYAYRESVSSLLRRLNITTDSDDIVSVDLSSYTSDGMIITVTKVSHETVQVTEPITYSSQRVANGSMTKGKETITQQGKNGSAKVTYDVTYENGVEVSREAISSEVITAAVPEITEYGTKAATITTSDRISADSRNNNGSGTLTFVSGNTLTYSRVINATATAYTSSSGARTASGKVACYGRVAVDPRVIPLGTKLYIQTPDGSIVYGVAEAADTGGAIKGNIVDLYYNTNSQCIQFGRRACTVYVLN